MSISNLLPDAINVSHSHLRLPFTFATPSSLTSPPLRTPPPPPRLYIVTHRPFAASISSVTGYLQPLYRHSQAICSLYIVTQAICSLYIVTHRLFAASANLSVAICSLFPSLVTIFNHFLPLDGHPQPFPVSQRPSSAFPTLKTFSRLSAAIFSISQDFFASLSGHR